MLPGLVVVPFLGLLYKQPDRGTMALFGLVTVVVLLLSGMPKRFAIIPALLGAGLGVHFYNSSKMVRDRMDAFLHPELYPQTTGSQALKSLAALREGGLEGVGLGEQLGRGRRAADALHGAVSLLPAGGRHDRHEPPRRGGDALWHGAAHGADRKSTRLNSSHSSVSRMPSSA